MPSTRIDTHQFVSRKADHLGFHTVDLDHGQLGGTQILFTDLRGDLLRVPGAGHRRDHTAVPESRNDGGIVVRPEIDETGIPAQGIDGPCRRQAVFAVEIDLLILGEGASCRQKEGGQIPGIGYLHSEFAPVGAKGKNFRESIRCLIEHGFVVVKEIAVIRRGGESIQFAAHHSGVHGARQILLLHRRAVGSADLGKRARIHQIRNLIVCEMEHVRRRVGIVKEDVFRLALAHHAVGEVVFLIGIGLGEGVAHIADHSLVILGAPHLQGDAGYIGIVGIFIVCVVFSASRKQGRHRRQSEKQREQSFHKIPPL